MAADRVLDHRHQRLRQVVAGDPENTDTLRSFVAAVLAIDPDATGPSVMLFEAAQTVVHAFIVSGIFALSAIEARKATQPGKCPCSGTLDRVARLADGPSSGGALWHICDWTGRAKATWPDAG